MSDKLGTKEFNMTDYVNEWKEKLSVYEENPDHIHNMNKDFILPFFDSIETTYKPDPDDPEKEIKMEKIIFKKFRFPKELKVDIFAQIAIAMSQNLQAPFTVLIPRKMIPTSLNLSDMTYPTEFLEAKLYIVPYIRDIMVLEND